MSKANSDPKNNHNSVLMDVYIFPYFSLQIQKLFHVQSESLSFKNPSKSLLHK